MQKENSEKTVFAYIVSQSSVGHTPLPTESNIFVLITFGNYVQQIANWSFLRHIYLALMSFPPANPIDLRFYALCTCDIISDFAPEFDIIGEYTSSNTQLVWLNQFLTL